MRVNLAVVLEGRFSRAKDGSVWSGAAFPSTFWSRYLDVFDGVTVIARMKECEPQDGDVRSDGPSLAFAPIPHYLGPLQYLAKRQAVRSAMRRALDGRDAVIMRVPSELANIAWPTLLSEGRPYGLEVVGDPYDVFAPGAVRHPLRPLLRHYFRRQLRRQCAGAAAVAYVTERTLQARYPLRYPARGKAPQRAFVSSDVVVPAVDLGHADPLARGSQGRVVFVGSLEQLYKGPDVLLRALAVCRGRGVAATLRMAGDGRCRPSLERLARRLGLSDAVVFLGALPPGEPVYRELRQADLFVLPSRTEGLPRALIEAMSLGLPCIASTAGGIPELLASEDLVAPGDVMGLAEQIMSALTQVPRREKMAARNLRRAGDFTGASLAPRKRAFCEYVRQVTEQWRAESPARGSL